MASGREVGEVEGDGDMMLTSLTILTLFWNLLMIVTFLLFVTNLIVYSARRYVQVRCRARRNELRGDLDDSGQTTTKKLTVAFFHPYCNAGGGGERVLWTAVLALHARYGDKISMVVYTGDRESKEEIISKVKSRFQLSLPSSSLTFIYLNYRYLVEASYWPHFTLAGQSLGSVVLGWEALTQFVPDIYIDSMGYAFTSLIFTYFGRAYTIAYVHYPTISSDMLERVRSNVDSYNNRSAISRNPVLTHLKLVYYRLFALLYGFAGRRFTRVMVNSSWTYGHICDIWKSPDTTRIVYPPCEIEPFLEAAARVSLSSTSGHQLRSSPSSQPSPSSSLDSRRLPHILSVGQFRPEKDHQLQIRYFAKFVARHKHRFQIQFPYRLILAGSCRNDEDEARVAQLEALAESLGVSQEVEIQKNLDFSDLLNLMVSSTIGLHTMWNEHFGIGIVEMMAAGLVVIAHNSGGPKMDIVKPYNGQPTGYLADSLDLYVERTEDVFAMTEDERENFRRGAREAVKLLDAEKFKTKFIDFSAPLFDKALEDLS